jgi:tetratricopeptide (TPR) repeat protein
MSLLFKHGSLVFLAAALAAPPALAEGPSSEASVEARRDAAKAKFQRGSELYDAGQYADAVHAFMEADRLSPSAALSFNIARAYERLSDTSGALRWYRDYLRRSPKAKNAAEVQQKVSALSQTMAQSGVQQVTVLSTPLGAEVVLDGRAVGVTPFTGDLALGKHRVLLTLSGYRDASHDVVLAADGPLDVSWSLDRAPAPLASKAAPAPAPGAMDRHSGRRFGVAPWVIAGTGIVGLGGALGFELARHSHENEAKDADQLGFKQHTDAMERDKTVARVLVGVGGALVVTGAVMLLLDQGAGSPASPRVALGCTFSGCSASARGAF